MKFLSIEHFGTGKHDNSPVLATISRSVLGEEFKLPLSYSTALELEAALTDPDADKKLIKDVLYHVEQDYRYEPAGHRIRVRDLQSTLHRRNFFADLPEAVSAEDKHSNEMGWLLAFEAGPVTKWRPRSLTQEWPEDRKYLNSKRAAITAITAAAIMVGVVASGVYGFLVLLAFLTFKPWAESFYTLRDRNVSVALLHSFGLIDHRKQEDVNAFYAAMKRSSEEEAFEWISKYYWDRLVREESQALENHITEELSPPLVNTEIQDLAKAKLAVLQAQVKDFDKTSSGSWELLQAQRALLLEIRAAEDHSSALR